MSDLPRDTLYGAGHALDSDERLIAVFQADAGVYARSNAVVALVGAVLAATVLVALRNPDPWVGPVAALSAVGIRALYLRSEAMTDAWALTNRRLLGPGGRVAALSAVRLVRPFFGAVQIVTAQGDKHLIRYQADAAATVAAILAAKAARG